VIICVQTTNTTRTSEPYQEYSHTSSLRIVASVCLIKLSLARVPADQNMATRTPTAKIITCNWNVTARDASLRDSLVHRHKCAHTLTHTTYTHHMCLLGNRCKRYTTHRPLSHDWVREIGSPLTNSILTKWSMSGVSLCKRCISARFTDTHARTSHKPLHTSRCTQHTPRVFIGGIP